MKKKIKLYLIVCLTAIVITSIVVTYEGVNREQEVFQPSLPSTNTKESAIAVDENAPLVSDPFKSFLDNKSNQGNRPLEPRALEVEFFPMEEVLHEKVKIH